MCTLVWGIPDFRWDLFAQFVTIFGQITRFARSKYFRCNTRHHPNNNITLFLLTCVTRPWKLLTVFGSERAMSVVVVETIGRQIFSSFRFEFNNDITTITRRDRRKRFETMRFITFSVITVGVCKKSKKSLVTYGSAADFFSPNTDHGQLTPEVVPRLRGSTGEVDGIGRTTYVFFSRFLSCADDGIRVCRRHRKRDVIGHGADTAPGRCGSSTGVGRGEQTQRGQASRPPNTRRQGRSNSDTQQRAVRRRAPRPLCGRGLYSALRVVAAEYYGAEGLVRGDWVNLQQECFQPTPLPPRYADGRCAHAGRGRAAGTRPTVPFRHPP